MATEQELREARAAHAARLEAIDDSAAFPNRLKRPDGSSLIFDDRERSRLIEEANDAEVRKRWPREDELDGGEPVRLLYGRVMAKRGPFLVVQTPHGRTQTLVRKNELHEREAAQLATLDLGDHVAVEGPTIQTKTGDAAVKAVRYWHLGKAMLPPPAKWHGLKDVEKRYRERYVDLFANPQVAEVFRARSRIVQELRRFLDARGFLEVETPVLQQVRGGATARPFTTHHNALDLDLYLRIALELPLKRLLVGGFDRVYELGRVFRNEGISTQHNPEFTLLEFYMAYATYEDLMDLTEQLLRAVDAGLHEHLRERPSGTFEWLAGNRRFELDEPFARVTMRRAIVERIDRAGEGDVRRTAWTEVLDEATVYDAERLRQACERVQGRLEPEERELLARADSYGKRVFALFELLVEPELTRMYRTADGARSRPVFITEFPIEVSPLARKSDRDPGWVHRFELFVEGGELVNAFDELNDPDDQAERFQQQLTARSKGDEEAMDFDEDYVRALLHGMPPAAGFGLGVDRLALLLLDQPSIRDVLLFPLLRPEAK